MHCLWNFLLSKNIGPSLNLCVFHIWKKPFWPLSARHSKAWWRVGTASEDHGCIIINGEDNKAAATHHRKYTLHFCLVLHLGQSFRCYLLNIPKSWNKCSKCATSILFIAIGSVMFQCHLWCTVICIQLRPIDKNHSFESQEVLLSIWNELMIYLS